jgi:hypothetical protein
LLDNDVEGKFMKNFLDFADDRLIVLDAHGNFEKEWMDDWMRAFKGNPSEIQAPVAPLESLTEQQRGFLKQVLDDPDPGDCWKLDDPVWANGAEPPFPHNYWTRGIIAEIDLYQQQYRLYGYEHLPVAQAIDYTKLGKAVQVKTIKNPATATARMEKAIRDLIAAAPTGDLKLHVLVKPGQDAAPLRAHLETYLFDEFRNDVGRFELRIVNYSAIP